MIPAYLKTVYQDEPNFDKFKTFFTIHNLSYQGEFPKSSFKKTGLPDNLNSDKGILHKGKLNYMKSGLLFADTINTVSETYANEIRTDNEIGSGLKDILAKRKEDLYGIINGIDTKVWNPDKDKHLPKKYSLKNIEQKVVNKQALAEKFGFEFNEDIPIIGLISRLYDSKGIDLVEKILPNLLKEDVQMIILGTGEKNYHTFFDQMARKHHKKFACYLGFNDDLAHLIEGGADILLMPSKYEPCGLNQMYSLNYGTIPIVRETGGLADTVKKFNEKTKEGNGFVFKKYSADELLSEIKRALKLYKDKETWNKLVKAAMKEDFSWHSSAKKYIELYKTILNES